MAATRKRARLAPVLFTSALAMALLAAAWLASEAARQAALLERFEQAGDSELPSLLRQAMQRTSAGVDLCLLAFQSEHAATVAAAREVLFEEMARWQWLSDAEANRRRQQLACELAAQVDLLSDTGRSAASEVATQLLSSPSPTTSSERRSLTLACETVLQAGPPFANEPRVAMPARSRSAPVRTASWTTAPPAEPVEVSISARRTASDPHSTPAASAILRLSQSSADDVPADRSFSPAIVATPAGPSDATHGPGLLPSDMSHAVPIVNQSVAEMHTPVIPRHAAVEPSAAGLPQVFDASSAATPKQESQMETMQLVERLHVSGSTGQRARQELLQRGLTSIELEIAERLSDPDPAMRLRWLEALPGLPHLDARPWLVWLSRDADADVRLAALSIMATSGEPEMMRRVAEMAREEIEPRVKQRASDILHQLDRSARAKPH